MQQITWKDESRLRNNTDFDEFWELLKAPETKSVALHKPGSTVMRDGIKYRVNDNGCWVKI